MRRLMTMGAALVLMLSGAMTTYADVGLREPSSIGSQVIFYYDTREGFTTFASINQIGSTPVTVQIDYWGPTFETKVTQTLTFAPFAGRVIDVGALKATNGLGAQQGIAVASVIDEFGNPINPYVLTGNFTVANLATGSAWGSPVAGRVGRNAVDGTTTLPSAIVDGTNVVYQSFQVDALNLAAYYDPQTLAPVSAHGNQVIFINFKNATGVGSPLTSASTAWALTAMRIDGQQLPSRTVTVSGVSESDLVSLLGEDANGSAGRVIFLTRDTAAGVSHLIFFVQSLGTFGTGYLLPSTLN